MIIEVGNIRCKCLQGDLSFLAFKQAINKIDEYLKVRGEGYQHSPAYKRKVWDGYTHFISADGRFLVGLLPYVLGMLQNENIAYTLVHTGSQAYLAPPKEILTDLAGNVLTLRDYQYQALQNLYNSKAENIPFNRGIIDAATNAGKSAIMLGIAKMLEAESRPMYIFAHNALIVKQLYADFKQYFEDVNIIAGGEKLSFGKINICTIQKFSNALVNSLDLAKNFANAACVLVDEAHRLAGKTYKQILSKTNAPMRIAASGTPLAMDDKVAKIYIIGQTGERLIKISNSELMERGISQKPKVLIHTIKFNFKSFTYSDAYQELLTSDTFISKVVEIVRECEGAVLVSCQFTEIGQKIYQALQSIESKKIMYADGKQRDKAQIVTRFATGEGDVLVASMILKEGVNIPRIRNLVRTELGKSEITLKQIVGRAIRSDGKNSTVLVHDFFIDGIIKGTASYETKHSKRRIKLYKQEGFEIQNV